MSGKREIRVALTHDEYVALKNAVAGELEGLTEFDEESGVFNDLHAADQALVNGWRRYMARKRRQR